MKLIIIFLVLASGTLFAESCSGPTYANDTTCGGGGNCPVQNCQDVSFAQDSTSFQCCPPGVAELPSWANFFVLTLVLACGLFWKYYRRQRKLASNYN